MNTFAIELWFDETTLCSFYTVRKNGFEDTETDRFFIKFENEDNKYYNSAQELLQLIIGSIGNTHGAIDDFFDRVENQAQALPPKPKTWIPEIKELGIHFPLRLLCFRISESIVVLFNGGIKDGRTQQESTDLSISFYEAQEFAKRIAEALRDKTILISENKRILTDFQGNTEFIL